jgi:hypothetical protein
VIEKDGQVIVIIEEADRPPAVEVLKDPDGSLVVRVAVTEGTTVEQFAERDKVKVEVETYRDGGDEKGSIKGTDSPAPSKDGEDHSPNQGDGGKPDASGDKPAGDGHGSGRQSDGAHADGGQKSAEGSAGDRPDTDEGQKADAGAAAGQGGDGGHGAGSDPPVSPGPGAPGGSGLPPAAPPGSEPGFLDTFEVLLTVGTALISQEVKMTMAPIENSHFFELGWARKGFLEAGGMPFSPPTGDHDDPQFQQDIKEWERGQQVGLVIAVAEAIAGGGEGMPPGGAPGLVPAGPGPGIHVAPREGALPAPGLPGHLATAGEGNRSDGAAVGDERSTGGAPKPPAPKEDENGVWERLKALAEKFVPRQTSDGFRVSPPAREGNREVVIVEGRIGEKIPSKEGVESEEVLPGEDSTHPIGKQQGEDVGVQASAPRGLNRSDLKIFENATRRAADVATKLGAEVNTRTEYRIERQMRDGKEIQVLVGVRRELWLRPHGSDKSILGPVIEAAIDPTTRKAVIRENTLPPAGFRP